LLIVIPAVTGPENTGNEFRSTPTPDNPVFDAVNSQPYVTPVGGVAVGVGVVGVTDRVNSTSTK
jgi:hypothetical protein